MKVGLRTKEAIEAANDESHVLPGFSVTVDHSLVLCEAGFEHYYGKVSTKGDKDEVLVQHGYRSSQGRTW